MQWSCPHCGISLAVTDHSLGTGWSFSRCYKCGGFALVRKAEINIIKVDKAPPGEKVILPEAPHRADTGLLTEQATQNLVAHVQPKNPTPPPFPTLSQNPPASFDITSSMLPEPLSELPKQSPSTRIIPAGIALASFLAVGSGVYLYIQGQALWQKTRTSALNSHTTYNNSTTTAETNEPSTEKEIVAPPSLFTSEPIPTELGKVVAQAPIHPVITDQVQQSAMAPLKSPYLKDETSPVFFVKIRSDKANLYSGPGLEYPVISTAHSNIKYRVSEWRDRWFKIAHGEVHSPDMTGWIRNDLVQILQ